MSEACTSMAVPKMVRDWYIARTGYVEFTVRMEQVLDEVRLYTSSFLATGTVMHASNKYIHLHTLLGN